MTATGTVAALHALVVVRQAEAHAHGNTHADGRVTFLAISQVGHPIQFFTQHNAADVDPDPTAGGQGVQCGRRDTPGSAPSSLTLARSIPSQAVSHLVELDPQARPRISQR